MSKTTNNKKYKRGDVITSLEELSQQEFIYVVHDDYEKIYHHGWFKSWQFKNIEFQLKNKTLYKAVKKMKYEIVKI